MATEYFTVGHLPLKQLTRFFSKVRVDLSVVFNSVPCWIWTAGKDNNGYGYFKWKSSRVIASRFTYAWLIEPIPRGRKSLMEVDHLCRNRSCCNPIHLELVPTPVNRERSTNPSAENGRKTHCKHGHEFSSDNTLYRSFHKNRKHGGRECRQCIRDAKPAKTLKDMARARERYANNAEYRAKVKRTKTEQHRLNMLNPEYREKRRLRSRAYRLRHKAA